MRTFGLLVALKDKQQVGANAADRAGDGVLRAGADRQHGDHRRHADHDPQDGQPGAQFVGAQAFQGFEERSCDSS